MDEHDDDQELEVQEEAAVETESFPGALDDVEDIADEGDRLEIDPDESEL